VTQQLMVSVDLDDAWAYLRARGERGWESAPSIIPLATVRLLELFEASGIDSATVFIVGTDARLDHGRAAIRAFEGVGFEIGDHSLEHRSDLASRSSAEIVADLSESRSAIAEVTGRSPNGFRCPSFGASAALSAALRELDYGYDASALPTPLTPLLRAYYRLRMSEGDESPSYGNLRTAFASLRPKAHGGIVSIPTTTMPLVRVPFHGSYLSALAGRSLSLASAYGRLADRMCRVHGLPVSFLLHPTDVLDRSDAPHLGFFPGMSVPWTAKRKMLGRALANLRRSRELVDLGTSASAAATGSLSS
jgi:peptidoglycan/xylan/chitin deacetylase (PgdA/CDA1 family)